MIAILLPDHRETVWLLVPPLIWEKITRQLQGLREPRQKKERAPGVATPIPDVLPPQILQQAEEHLARLVEMPEVRTAFLLNPLGRVSACKGPDTQDVLQRYSDSRDDLSGPTSLTNEHELRRQLGHQPQNISAVPYIEKKAIRQEQREADATFNSGARRIDAGRMVLTGGRNLPSGWRLVVFADRDMKEERRQHIHQAWRELRHILTQRASD
jgi:hypothetical protein